MLSNYIYVGNYQHRKRIQNEETILLEDVYPSTKSKRKEPKELYSKTHLYLYAKNRMLKV